MMSDKEKSYTPSAERRFWLYNPDGDGMVYYRTREARDADAAQAVKAYSDTFEGWPEEVEFVSAGEVTHYAQCADKTMRPEKLDEEDCDEDGTWWDADWEWMGNYAMEPCCPPPGRFVGRQHEDYGITAFETWWLSQPEDLRRAYPPGGVDIARDGFRAGVMAGTAEMAKQLKDSGAADFVTSTRNGVVRTGLGRCEPNTKYALIPMPPNA